MLCVLLDVLNDREARCDGLNRVRQLAYHHPKVFGLQLHAVTLAVTSEARKLLSPSLAYICMSLYFVKLDVYGLLMVIMTSRVYFRMRSIHFMLFVTLVLRP